MPETIYKLQPDRTLSLRGFNTFAAAASIHHASPTGFQVSGTFRDPADFAVAVLYDADNVFEHPSIKYLPDFNFAGLTLNFRLLYSDGVQPIDSPKYNWIDWATLDVIRADGTTAGVPLWDNAILAGGFPAASTGIKVLAPNVQPFDRITLWYENLAFDFTTPGGIAGASTWSWQAAETTAAITVGSTTYTYNVNTPGGEDGPTIAAGVAAAAASDPLVQFNAPAGSNVITFKSRVNTGAAVLVSGYHLWLITEPAGAWIAKVIVGQINACDWTAANTSYGLFAAIVGTPGVDSTFSVTAAGYGSVTVNSNVVSWGSGTKFSGLTAGDPFLIGETVYTVASVQSPAQLTLTAPAGTGQYLAPRGGRDGNMIELYTLATSPTTTSFDNTEYQLAGGGSAAPWDISLDFTALGIDSIRQCWLTFAPSLAEGRVRRHRMAGQFL